MIKQDNSTTKALLELHGPLMHGKVLYKALGFNSYRVFYTHLIKNNIKVNLFQIDGRPGWFARTTEVADWINQQAQV